jgi:hypothetical protein
VTAPPTTRHPQVFTTNFIILNISRPTNFFFTHHPSPTTHHHQFLLGEGDFPFQIPTRAFKDKNVEYFKKLF